MPVEHPVLCLDYGEARIGVAATDVMGIAVHAVESVDARDEPLVRIAELVAEKQVAQVVVGLPLLRDGSEGSSAQKVRTFAKQLAKALPESLTITFADERQTTVTASAKLREAGRKAKRQREVIDQVAAMEILREWLNDHGGDY